MADYKDIITGTLNNIVGKVKEVADSGAIKDIYEHGANRAKSYGQMAKLSLEINGDSEELKRVYAEIGRLYYDQQRTLPWASSRPCSSRPPRSLRASTQSRRRSRR